MPLPNRDDWKPWLEERNAYADRETRGFTSDLEALREHIKTLQKVCPKDKAGWPVGKALSVLGRLKRDYDTICRVFGISPR